MIKNQLPQEATNLLREHFYADLDSYAIAVKAEHAKAFALMPVKR